MKNLTNELRRYLKGIYDINMCSRPKGSNKIKVALHSFAKQHDLKHRDGVGARHYCTIHTEKGSYYCMIASTNKAKNIDHLAEVYEEGYTPILIRWKVPMKDDYFLPDFVSLINLTA